MIYGKKYRTIDNEIEDQIRNYEHFWRKVLRRLFDITMKLAGNSSSFRGHNKLIGDVYNGNILPEVELLAKYDDVLKNVLEMPTGSIKYLSPTIQNEIIQCIGENLQEKLITNIKLSPCYSILLNSTQDITKVDQLSIVIRYVQMTRIHRSEPITFEIKETFF